MLTFDNVDLYLMFEIYKVSLCILQITLRFVRELCIFSHEYSRKPKKLHNIN